MVLDSETISTVSFKPIRREVTYMVLDSETTSTVTVVVNPLGREVTYGV